MPLNVQPVFYFARPRISDYNDPMLSILGDAFIHTFFPAACPGCNCPLKIGERQICRRCSAKLKHSMLSGLDSQVPHSIKELGTLWSFYPYCGLFRDLWKEIKFQGQFALVEGLLDLCKKNFIMIGAEKNYDWIIPIPQSLTRRIVRKYNPAEEIARIVASRFGTPLKTRYLKKKYDTIPQSLLGKSERRSNVRDVFRAVCPGRIADRKILLVDDLVTTGATAREAARELRRKGARSVDMLTVGFTVLEGSDNPRRII